MTDLLLDICECLPGGCGGTARTQGCKRDRWPKAALPAGPAASSPRRASTRRGRRGRCAPTHALARGGDSRAGAHSPPSGLALGTGSRGAQGALRLAGGVVAGRIAKGESVGGATAADRTAGRGAGPVALGHPRQRPPSAQVHAAPLPPPRHLPESPRAAGSWSPRHSRGPSPSPGGPLAPPTPPLPSFSPSERTCRKAGARLPGRV